MFKNPRRRERPSYANKLEQEDFAAGRGIQDPAPIPAKRTLTANMTGQVSLAGSKFDLQFNKGCLKRISSNENILFDKLNSRTRFKTTKGSIEYRNESAFSFDDGNEYGLRTLQVPKKRKKYDCRVITDYTFSRDSDEAKITVTVDYPRFRKKSRIYESSLFEFRIENTEHEGIRIFSDSSTERVIKPESSSIFSIEGRIFEIRKGQQTIRLSLKNSSDSNNGSGLKALSFKSSMTMGRHFLYINPGGNYTPAPAEYYSGAREQFCFSIRIY